jgi:predicted transglutaminase-like cysteine proteinase
LSASSQSAAYRGPGLWKTLCWASLLLAGALYMLEPLFSSAAPIFLVAADHVGSDSILKKEVNAAYGIHEASATSDEERDRLFGLNTEPVTDGALLEKWRRVQARVADDLEVIAQCQAGKPCPAPAQRLIDLILEGSGQGGRTRVGVINRAVDLAISPVSDETQWGVPDHWSDPLETLQSSSGDCEDYAIVKYAALLAAGLPKDAVKIVVLRNRLPNEDHAVVAVLVDDQWLILDNRTLTLVRDSDVTRAIPEFVLDDRGVRRFVWSRRIQKAVS